MFKTREITASQFEEIRSACPYDIPRRDPETGLISKCTMCYERVVRGLKPVCVSVCPTGAMNFGEREEMLVLAKKRLKLAKKEHPQAMLADPDYVNVIYLLIDSPENYHSFSVAQKEFDMDRKIFLSRLVPGTLNLVLKFTLSAVLEVLVMKADLDSDTLSWKKGYCPVCGFPPSISCLAKASDAQSEFLKGGGGQKYLHCSLCGNNWRVKRHMCPVCENEDPKDRLYFQAEGAVGERVDVCRKCQFYLPCIDLREFSNDPHLDISAVSMVHLDIKAQEKGFKPVTQLPWNSFD
ncbi:MAG: formate dehydrogenase accessory protein FdhE [Thermodesulfobacteriota bacterium]|nr:formate dehydrogenase accessory protein FdhE [Thermodesulfobacteriota bacterium]